MRQETSERPTGFPLLRLDVACPDCGRHPGERVTPRQVSLHAHEPAEALMKTLRCQGCGEIYFVPARAYQRAR